MIELLETQGGLYLSTEVKAEGTPLLAICGETVPVIEYNPNRRWTQIYADVGWP
jgi:hypothetical protein